MHTNTLYLIENLTPLHAGSGEANFGVIDNLIQRDPITNYPMIHGSSLKGALREYMMDRLEYPKKNSSDQEEQSRYNRIQSVFGDEEVAGMVRFVDAHLLAVPMRASEHPYYLCVSPQSIKNYCEMAGAFGIAVDDALKAVADYEGDDILVASGTPTIEDTVAHTDPSQPWEALASLVGEPVAIVPNTLFEAMLDDLPVIARNQLENGESKNLFYEEVLPRKSRLFTVISYPKHIHKDDKKRLQGRFDYFHNALTEDGALIQIGGNATIGYGVCRFTSEGGAS